MRLGSRAAFALLVAAIGATPALAETPKRGGILNFAVTAEPPNYDCHASQTFALLHPVSPMFSYLVKYDSSQGGKIVGDLAKSWDMANDGLTYTFKLHEGVKFHDGSPLTSADVKASFDRIANPPTGVVSLRKSAYSIVKSIDAPDPTTVIFRLERGQCVDARRPGVALQLHLQRGQDQGRSEVPGDRTSWARAPTSSWNMCVDRI